MGTFHFAGAPEAGPSSVALPNYIYTFHTAPVQCPPAAAAWLSLWISNPGGAPKATTKEVSPHALYCIGRVEDDSPSLTAP